MNELDRIHAKRFRTMAVDEFYGLCLGVISDGVVNEFEARFLYEWLSPRIHHVDDPVVKAVFGVLTAAHHGGFTDKTESQLLELLVSYTGANGSSIPNENAPSSIPLCDPEPDIIFQGRSFCLTGTFDSGKRADCQLITTAAGGLISSDVTKAVDYLVIGNRVTPHWKHESYGRKIIRAMEYRELYGRISIVSEARWLAFAAATIG